MSNKTNEVIKIPKKDTEILELEKRVESIEKSTTNSETSEEDISLSSLSYGVNVNLQNHSEIESRLAAAGVAGFSEFGHNNSLPPELKVAISDHLPSEIKNKVMALARDLGIEHYSMIEQWEEIDDDVLFGAYGKTEGKITYRSA